VFGAITTGAFTGLATSHLASFDDSRDLEEDYFGGFLSTIFNYRERRQYKETGITVIGKRLRNITFYLKLNKTWEHIPHPY